MNVKSTPLQSGMLFHTLANSRSGVDVEHICIVCTETLDVSKLIASWNAVIDELPVLRTSFNWTDSDSIEQVVHDVFSLPVVQIDWSAVPIAEIAAKKQELMLDDRRRGFELAKNPPNRLFICKLAGSGYWLLWSFHHVLLDGRSFPLVLKQVFNRYDGLSAALDKPARPFSDYVDMLENQDHAVAAPYWREKLSLVENTTSFPRVLSDKDSLVEHRYSETQAAIEYKLPIDLSARAHAFAKTHGFSVNVLLQASWTLLLHHYTNKTTVVFGCTRATRHALNNTENTVGLLINTVPFCVELKNAESTMQLLEKVKQLQVELRDVETTPLIFVEEQVGVKEIFDTLLMYDNKNLHSRMCEEPSAQPSSRLFSYEGQTNYPLVLIGYGEPQLELRLEYNIEKYSGAFSQQLLSQLAVLLEAMINKPDEIATKLPYLSNAELAQLREWNDTNKPYNLDCSLKSIFEAQVARSPNAAALRFNGEQLTYNELNVRANQLAHYLIDLGVAPEDAVGIYCDRSFDLLIAIYAVIKAGAAFLPLDIGSPIDRVQFMLDDAKACIVLSSVESQDTLGRFSTRTVALSDSLQWQNSATNNPSLTPGANSLAYILYTSGSTGNPKGVMNEHRGIVNRLHWMQDAFKLSSEDAVLQKTPITFDVSVWELFWPLQVGARLVIAQPEGHRDTAYLANTIIQEKVTTLHFVPSMLQLFVEEPLLEKCGSIKRVICSGEALPRDLQDRLLTRLPTELHNLYGPTEAAIDVTWWRCDKESELPIVPIGKSIANTQIHILDSHLNPVPVGVSGELHIAGVQVARGYCNLQEQNTRLFIENPFDDQYKMYKTGDLARYLPDGNIEYLGRLDYQVKIRGQRVELGEIETSIVGHSGVDEVVVTAATDLAGELVLVAYVVGKHVNEADLMQYLGGLLPSHMLPSVWIELSEFKLNTSGKVDRSVLPAPNFSNRASSGDAVPQSDLEQQVHTVWCELLGQNDIDTDITFFDAGGNSLLVIRLANRMTDKFDRKVTVQTLLKETTIARQALYLSKDELASAKADVQLTTATAQANRQLAAKARRRQARGGRA